MKRLFIYIIAAMPLLSFISAPQSAFATTPAAAITAPKDKSGAAIEFTKTKHEFGTIKSSGGKVTAEYDFTNTGDKPLVIITVTNGGCGGTTPSFPKEPIAPGKTGKITINFDPTGRRGEFNRTVQVKTNAQKKAVSLRFSGVIVP